MTAISKKKANYKINKDLETYFIKYGRVCKLPIQYEELLSYSDTFPYIDKNGDDTLWETLIYPQYMLEELNDRLTEIYALLLTVGDTASREHLYIDRVDYCTFGNSHPFRIRVVNNFNDNYDYFYIKKNDASRIYGLELEHLLSPNKIHYLVQSETLIEEHIVEIPGDAFIRNHLDSPTLNKVRIAKEFVKFNERCFVKLLGDMRSYNYVVNITPDFEDEQYRVRAIDFDQQSYEGKKKMYFPQFFKENNAIVNMCVETMTPETIRQYQLEERTLMAKRMKSESVRLNDLLDCLIKDTISLDKKTKQIKKELAKHHQDLAFLGCKMMGEVVKLHLESMLLG